MISSRIYNLLAINPPRSESDVPLCRLLSYAMISRSIGGVYDPPDQQEEKGDENQGGIRDLAETLWHSSAVDPCWSQRQRCPMVDT